MKKNIKYLLALSLLLLLVCTGYVGYKLLTVPPKYLRGLSDTEQIRSGASLQRIRKIVEDEWGNSVRLGCDDWLFLVDELVVGGTNKKNGLIRLEMLNLVRQQLDARHIRLQLLVVPDKSRIELAHLCKLQRPAVFASRLSDWVAAAQAQHLPLLDISPILSSVAGERYYRSDSHWNEHGAQAAAQALATALHMQNPKAGAQDIVPSQVSRMGDLYRIAEFDTVPEFFRRKLEVVQQSSVPEIKVDSDDLFGDAGLPDTVLLGSSFSLRANFFPFLEYYSGQKMANLSKDGGNFDGAAIAYFSSDAFRQHMPKIVIWEFPERMLEIPISDDEKKWLARLQQGQL